MPDDIPKRPVLIPRANRDSGHPAGAPQPRPEPAREKPALRLKEQPAPPHRRKEEPANPLLARMPEPKAPLVPPRLMRALRVAGAVVFLTILVAGLLLFLKPGGQPDRELWQRSVATLQALEEKPADADALDTVKEIIMAVPDEAGNRSALSGMKAVYALGLLGRGLNPAGLAACRHVLERYPDAGFAEFVTYTNLAVHAATPSRTNPTARRPSPPNDQLGSTAHGRVDRLGDDVPPPRRIEKPTAPEDEYTLSKTRIREQYDAALKKALLLCRLKEAESRGRAALEHFQSSVKAAVTNEFAPSHE